VINVWSNDQKNVKPKPRQLTPFDDQPSSSRLNIQLGFPSDAELNQGKFTQNHSASAMNISHMMSNLQLNEPTNLHQSTVERRISSQLSHATSLLNHHQNSHGNYVEIDAIDSILLENDNNNFLHYSTNNIANQQSFDRRSAENHIQKLIDPGVNSPIYENQSYLRSESPIYSNTHSQSVASLYPKSQNIYSNLPAISSASTGAYANIQQSHQVLAPSE
jgi:hypothetical protein